MYVYVCLLFLLLKIMHYIMMVFVDYNLISVIQMMNLRIVLFHSAPVSYLY